MRGEPSHMNGPQQESTTDPVVEMSEYRDRRDLLHRNPTNRSDKSNRQTQDTFQRDLARTLDQYRRPNEGPPYHAGYGHM